MRLPSRKADLPICVYLDQNKWIDLARAHYGRADGQAFVPALAAARSAAASGTAIFPMSAVHVMETMAPSDEERRRRLATFMVQLSNNLAIAPHMVLRPIEILHAIKRLYGARIVSELRPVVVREGLAAALGSEVELSGGGERREDLERIIKSKEMSIELLVSAGDRDEIRSLRQQDEAMVNELEARRLAAKQTMSDEMKRRLEIAELFVRGTPGQELHGWLRELGVSPDEFFSKLDTPEKWAAFVEDIPTLNTWLALMMERDRNLGEAIHRNDTKDLGFLAVAVPYCNIVIAGRAWASRLRRTDLPGRYGTIISTDATELPTLLQQFGCIESAASQPGDVAAGTYTQR